MILSRFILLHDLLFEITVLLHYRLSFSQSLLRFYSSRSCLKHHILPMLFVFTQVIVSPKYQCFFNRLQSILDHQKVLGSSLSTFMSYLFLEEYFKNLTLITLSQQVLKDQLNFILSFVESLHFLIYLLKAKVYHLFVFYFCHPSLLANV